MPDHRTSIQTALQAFNTRPLREAALDLLGTLGYRSDKILHLPDTTPATFHDFIREHNPESTFSPEKALFDDWISAELLFQLTLLSRTLQQLRRPFPVVGMSESTVAHRRLVLQ